MTSVVVAHLHNDGITGAFSVSLDKLMAADDRVLFPPIRNQSNTDLSSGRNQCVTAFLDSTPGEWLLFIDDDMGFAPDIVDKLLDAADPVHRPVVGGLCFAYRRYDVSETHAHRMLVRPTIYTLASTPTDVGFVPVDEWPRDQVVPCDGTGAAMLLVHRRVLEEMRATDRGDLWFEPISVPLPNGSLKRFSEDLSFMWRLKLMGVQVHVHAGAKTHHRKPIDLDEWYFDNQPIRLSVPEVMIAGTGYCGTRFIADLLTSCGVVCGHEGWWSIHQAKAPALRADASWFGVPALDDWAGPVWHQVRDPLAVIASMAVVELGDDAPVWTGQYRAIRESFAGPLPADPVAAALRVVRVWWEAAEARAARTWRVEDVGADLLADLLGEFGVPVPPAAWVDQILAKLGTDTNAHRSPLTLTWDDLPDGDDKDAVRAMAERFGYATVAARV